MLFSIAYSDLRDSIFQYLTGESTLEEFEERFADSLQGYLDSGDDESVTLANEVNAVLVESMDENDQESQIKAELYRALCPDSKPLSFTRSSGYADTSTARYAPSEVYPAVVIASLVSEGISFAAVGTSH